MKKGLPLVLAAVLFTGSLVASGFSRKAMPAADLPPEGGSYAAGEGPQQLSYLDSAKPLDDRVDDLLRQLTLAEKISLLGTTAPAIERLKVPAMNGWNQSLHGIVWTEPTTMFPVPISMAPTNKDSSGFSTGRAPDSATRPNRYRCRSPRRSSLAASISAA